jgi:hypothetical protein
MVDSSALLLIAAVAAVGVLHTLVPDHWVPITLIARRNGWSVGETARAALQAGTGHVSSTLILALVVWFAGVAAAERFGHVVDTAASVALIAFGVWVGTSAWLDLRRGRSRRDRDGGEHSHLTEYSQHHHHGHAHRHPDDPESAYGMPAEDDLYLTSADAVALPHRHTHRHGESAQPHTHWHDHSAADAHPVGPAVASDAPLHRHRHRTKGRIALLLILGSSPMVEGIPAFFAAERFGAGLLGIMAAVFAISTIATYVLLCVYSTAGLQRVRLGPMERYGEVLSGGIIAAVGLAFWAWPAI